MANAAMQRQPRPRLFALAALAGLGFAGAVSPARAQPAPFSEEPTQYRSNKPYEQDVEREQRRRDEEAGVRPASPLTVVGGIDLRDQYFFRGYNYVSSGLTAQPYVALCYTVFKDRDLAVTPHAGGWLDISEEEGPNPPTHFQEFRGNLGVAVDVGRLVFDFQYIYYTSPSDSFGDTQEVGVDVRYDDRDCWRHSTLLSGLNPSFSFFHEVQDDRDNEENTFLGVGLEPALRPWAPSPALPITVSFPVTVGGSYDGYYEDAHGHNANFGYWEAGVRAAMPLGRGVFGVQWSVDAEVDYIRLMARSARAANGFDDDDIFFRIGFAFR